MLTCLATELVERKGYLRNEEVKTIYFGGGTPSLLETNELQSLLDTIHRTYRVSPEAEVTIETNPDDILEKSLAAWKELGINRLSIGVQSFRKEDLEWMNRAHTVEEGENCIALAQQFGFENLTVDLIYGLPDLSLKDWENHVQRLIGLNVPHISAYCLTIEKKTALNSWVNKGKIIPASEEQESEQFLLLLDLLEKNGYEQYEISNFCKPGFESKHNSAYWKGENYLGIGPSAHSYDGKTREWNISNNQLYMDGIEDNKRAFEEELLSPADRFNEAILVGLRTAYGVDLDNLELDYIDVGAFTNLCDEFIAQGLMVRNGNKLILSKQGKLQADYIASELFVDANGIKK